MANILVAYATKHHSTEEIAGAITSNLRAHGNHVDCVDAEVATAEGYDAVVLGSAVYIGHWRREAKRFLKREHELLAHIPFWIFSSGPVGENASVPEEDAKWLEPKAVVELAESLGVRGHVVFGGRMPVDPHGFVETSMVRSTPIELLDNRDWDEIKEWADAIATSLAGAKL